MDEELMQVRRQMEQLRAQLADLTVENNKLRQKTGEEAGGWPQEPTAPVAPEPPAAPVPAALPSVPVEPPPTADEPTPVFCPICHRRARAEALHCAGCGYPVQEEAARQRRAEAEISAARRKSPADAAPAAAPATAAAAADEPGFAEKLQRLTRKLADSVRGYGAERLIGEKLLNYVGSLMLVLAGAFYLKYTWGFAGPLGKLAVGLGSGAALIYLGERLRRSPDFELFSVPLIGGGWILAYYTVFAAHWLPAARMVQSPALALALLCATAAGMIAHSLKARSRLLTAFAFSTAYFAFAVTHLGAQTLTVCTVLALAGAVLVRALGHPELAAVNLAGFYANYLPVFRLAFAAGGRGAADPDFWWGLGLLTAAHAAYALAAPPRETKGGGAVPAFDAVLSLGSVLYACLFYGQITTLDATRQAAPLLAVAALLAGLSALRGKADKAAALSSVQAFLAFAIALIGAYDMPSPVGRLWAAAVAAGAFGALGVWLERPAYEKYGLALAGFAAFAGVGAWGADPWTRAGALAFLGATGYALAALRRARRDPGDTLTAVWLYAGLGFSLWAPWTCLQPAAFALAAMTLALALEWAADAAAAPALLQQALQIELGVGLYAFLLDYGANAPLLGPLTPRLLVSACLVSAYAWLVFAAPAPEGSFLGVTYASWRRGSSWLMTGLGAFAVYLEFGPRLRLPIWALAALLLLALGRRRGNCAVHLRAQAYLLTLGTAAEGVISYLYFPPALMPVLGWRETALFTASALCLLSPVFWAAWAQGPEERSEELGAGYLFAILSLSLLALFVAKEADGGLITLGWTLLGVSYMLGGLATARKSLRLPALVLIGLCVLKALFKDMTGLALPYRVLSYAVMGGLLLLSSYVYVRRSAQEDADAA